MNGSERTTHTHITHPASCAIYNVNERLALTSAASISDNQTCRIIHREERDESESLCAHHVIFAPSRHQNIKMSSEQDTAWRRLYTELLS